MKISKEEVEHVAKLARLEFTEAEKEAFSKQLSAILTYVEQLRTLDTEGVEPTATVLEQTNVFREDRAAMSSSAPRRLQPVLSDRFLAGRGTPMSS